MLYVWRVGLVAPPLVVGGVPAAGQSGHAPKS
jgi:hypothetical protein